MKARPAVCAARLPAWLRVAWLLVALACLAGCGQKGPLIMPETGAESPAATSPQPGDDEDQRSEQTGQ